MEVVATSNIKITILRSIVLTAVLAVSGFASTTFRPFILELPPGSSPASVQKILGAPTETIGQDLWVYSKFSGVNQNNANPAFDTLVVAFENKRVVAVKITDGRVVGQLVAQHKTQIARGAVAAK